jgi:hypothetical protein
MAIWSLKEAVAEQHAALTRVARSLPQIIPEDRFSK